MKNRIYIQLDYQGGDGGGVNRRFTAGSKNPLTAARRSCPYLVMKVVVGMNLSTGRAGIEGCRQQARKNRTSNPPVSMWLTADHRV